MKAPATKLLVIEFNQINELATLLRHQVISYAKTNFPNLAQVNQQNLIAALTELLATPDAKSALDPNKSYFASATSAVASFGWSLGSTVRVTGAPIKYHRLPHLLYFTEKAEELQNLADQLLSYSQQNALLFTNETTAEIDKIASDFVNALKELFTTTKNLTEAKNSSMILAKVKDKQSSLFGLISQAGGSVFASTLTHEIMSTYFSQCTAMIAHINNCATLIKNSKISEKTITTTVADTISKTHAANASSQQNSHAAEVTALSGELNAEKERVEQFLVERSILEEHIRNLMSELAANKMHHASYDSIATQLRQAQHASSENAASLNQKLATLAAREEQSKTERHKLELEIHSLKEKVAAQSFRNNNNNVNEGEALKTALQQLEAELSTKVEESHAIAGEKITISSILRQTQDELAFERRRVEELAADKTRTEDKLRAAEETLRNIGTKHGETEERWAAARAAAKVYDSEGYCPLHRAIIDNKYESVLQALTVTDANYRTQSDQDGQNSHSPLYLALFDRKDPYKLRNDLDIEIVKALLKQRANPNEIFGHCSYLHAVIFHRNAQSKNYPYQLRSAKKINIKLAELLLEFGASIEALPTDGITKGNDVPANMPGIIANTKNETPIALLLRTCDRFSIKNLTELLEAYQNLHDALKRLQLNENPLIQRETVNLVELINKYGKIFEIYFHPDDVSYAKAAENFNINEFPRDVDSIRTITERVTKLRNTEKSKQVRQQAIATLAGRNSYDDLISILQIMDSCVAKAQNMYKVRYQTDTNARYVLTEMEVRIIVKNLPTARKAFANNEVEKLRRAMNDPGRVVQQNMHVVNMDDTVPEQLTMK